MTAKLWLHMIVKDEAPIIERCLQSVLPWISGYSIHDTGSTDGTPDIINQFFEAHDVPGWVTYGRFEDFAQARNDALGAIRRPSRVDYLLLADADMELTVDDPAWRDDLTADAYLIDQHAGGLRYGNVRLLRIDAPARYVGVTHEVLELDTPAAHLTGVSFVDHTDGSSRTGKFERDLTLLERGLEEDPDNARYVFYRAQTLRDLGRRHAAIAAYQTRADMGGWEEEVWYSLLQVALLLEQGTFQRHHDILIAFLAAFERRPHRAETLVELARFLRMSDRHDLAHAFASRAVQLPVTDDILFVTPSAYGWRALDELAISSYWVGDYVHSAALCRTLLRRMDLPAGERPRVEKNLTYAVERFDE